MASIDPKVLTEAIEARLVMVQDDAYRKAKQQIEDFIDDELRENGYENKYSWNMPKNELFLGHMKLSKVPVKIGQLKSLTLLDLSDNQLNDLSDVDATPYQDAILKWDGTQWSSGSDETNEAKVMFAELFLSEGRCFYFLLKI